MSTTSRLTFSWCCWIARVSGIVSLSTTDRDDPSATINSYPPSFFCRVAIPFRWTKLVDIKFPLAPESIMACVACPLTMHLVRNTGAADAVGASIMFTSWRLLLSAGIPRFLNSILASWRLRDRFPNQGVRVVVLG